MTIRLARPKDVTDLMALYHHLSASYQDNCDAIEAAIKHPATFVYVALQNGVIMGTATLSVRAVPCKGLVGYVDDVVVDPTYRGQGIAKALMNQLIDAARQLDCVRIDLTSNLFRKAGIRLYENLGFRRHDTNVMRLPL